MHLVTSIKDLTKQKSLVTLDHDVKIALYKGEIRRFSMTEGEEIEESVYHQIFEEILPKRARERAYNLLMRRQMTRAELVKKLRDGYYPEELIEKTLSMLEKHHYIDDSNYVDTFLEFRNKNKSRKQLEVDLRRKGVSIELIKESMEDKGVDDLEAIRTVMRKKRFDPTTASKEERQKFCMSLMRKGFSYEKISKVVGEAYDE